MERILIVDDEIHVCSSLRRLFQRAGFQVETAVSGAEALDKLAAFQPDAVLSDFRMPHMNGAELLAEVRRRLPQAVRIIISGYADLASVAESVREGEICRFISKPWDYETLVPTIRALLKPREELALLQQNLARSPQRIESELIQHASSIELRVRPDEEPFTAARALSLIRKLAGLLEDEELSVVSGLLERQGGRFTLTADIGGQHRLSLEVPLTAEQLGQDPAKPRQ